MTRTRIFLCSVAGVTASLLAFGAVGASCTSGAPGISLNPALEEPLGVDASVGTGGGASSDGGSDASVDGAAAPGTTCSSDADCASGSCAGGHCCATDCHLHCDSSCNTYLAGTCDATGFCNRGAILPQPDRHCDNCNGFGGSGVLLFNGPQASCSYGCGMICPSNDGAACEQVPPGGTTSMGTGTGFCSCGACVVTAQPNGFEKCLSDAQCQSGFCTSNTPLPGTPVCCDTACTGPCEICSEGTPVPSFGVCTPLSGTSCPGGTCQAGVCTSPDGGVVSGTGGAGTSSSSSTSSSTTASSACGAGTSSSTTSSGTGGAVASSSSSSGVTSTGTGGAATGTTSSGTMTTSTGVGGSVTATTSTTTSTTTSGATSSGGGHPGTGGADAGAVVTSSSCAATQAPTSASPWAGLLLALLFRRRPRR